MELRFYIIRRALILIPTFLGLTVLMFILFSLIPEQLLIAPYLSIHQTLPRAYVVHQATILLGLNLPLPLRYFKYVWNMFHGNLGVMNLPGYPSSVAQAIAISFPNTLQLAIFSTILAVVIAIPLGTYIGARPNSVADQTGRIFSLSGYAMPAFWLGLLLQIGLGRNVIPGNPVGIFPIQGSVPDVAVAPPWFNNGFTYPTHIPIIDALIHQDWSFAYGAFMHLVLPTLTLTYGILAGVLRFVRAGMVDSARQEFVKTARAKGVPEREVIKKHIRKNALIPTITVMGLLLAGLLGGVVVVEEVFDYPGIGLLSVLSATTYQVYGVIGTTLVFGIILMVANLIVDVLYALVDPRIRY
jgi:ABC-type dipeptide/oligopeptide/nickel transport system permease component